MSKILIAGATGVIGHSLMPVLNRNNYRVYGITQSEKGADKLRAQGAEPLIINILDEKAVQEVVAKIEPDVVINMLTSLPKHYTPEEMAKAGPRDAEIREIGGSNLLNASERNGVKRYILQSGGFFYEAGTGLADESTPFALNASPGVAAGAALYKKLEENLFQKRMEGVALRFGFFYGPGTWFNKGADMDNQLQAQSFPLIGKGEGIWNFVHIEDVAQAIESAIEAPPGIYNVSNDTPVAENIWLPALARFVGAPPPPQISEEQAFKLSGPDAVYYATKLRGISSQKAKDILNFTPRPLEWLT